jgi:hypothetical protein
MPQIFRTLSASWKYLTRFHLQQGTQGGRTWQIPTAQ